MQKVDEAGGRHIESRVDAKRVHPRRANPVAISAAQRAPHPRVLGVQIVQAGHLVAHLLQRIGVVADVGRPVVDAGAAMRGQAGVVQMEGRLSRCSHRRRRCIALKVRSRIGRVPAAAVAKVIAGVVEHDVLHQIHAAPVQAVGQALIVQQRAQVLVDAHEVLGPVAVVAGIGPGGRAPLVGHRRRDPQRGGPQALDVVQPPGQAAQIAALVAVVLALIEFARAEIVVARIAVVEAVGHREVDDLVAPIGRGDVQFQRGGWALGSDLPRRRQQQREAGGAARQQQGNAVAHGG